MALDRLIDAEQARFLRLLPRSAAAWREGRDHFLYGAPSHWMRRWAGGFPIYVDAASGSRLRDIDGRDYIDFCLGDTGAMCGHAPVAVTRAVMRQIGRGATMMLPTEDSLWVGAELSRRFGPRYWTLTTSATDANRAAIRIARMITGRTKVLVFSGCYHGGVDEAHVEIREGRIGLRNMIHANAVDYDAVTRIVEFNDIAAVEAAVAAGDVACVLTEPVLTNFGMIPVADGFHRRLRDTTRAAGTVLIIDETHTLSCGPGGYTALHGLEPDIFVAGKAMAGGIPAGIFGLDEAIAERLWRIVPPVNPRQRQSAHLGFGGTLAGGALAVAAMRAVLEEVLTAPALYSHDRACRAACDARPRHHGEKRSALARDPDRRAHRDHVHAGGSARRRRRDRRTMMHAFYMNEGILIKPFHGMLLTCPATSSADVDQHGDVFESFVRLVRDAGVI
jgi:glutamate-1-semialdehyde 2,1-aminomutase